jgi:hypothetical protein
MNFKPITSDLECKAAALYMGWSANPSTSSTGPIVTYSKDADPTAVPSSPAPSTPEPSFDERTNQPINFAPSELSHSPTLSPTSAVTPTPALPSYDERTNQPINFAPPGLSHSPTLSPTSAATPTPALPSSAPPPSRRGSVPGPPTWTPRCYWIPWEEADRVNITFGDGKLVAKDPAGLLCAYDVGTEGTRVHARLLLHVLPSPHPCPRS